MLSQAIILLFLNPAFPESGEVYQSGLKYVEKSYISDRPSTAHPLITIDFLMQDMLYNVVQPGIYAVMPSSDMKRLEFMQGNKVIAQCPVVQVIELKTKQAVPEAKIGHVSENSVYIIYKKDTLEIHALLRKMDF